MKTPLRLDLTRFGQRSALWCGAVLLAATGVLAALAAAATPSARWCEALPDDDVAFLLCRRSAQMHAVCDSVEAGVRPHCERCLVGNQPLTCADLAPTDAARCEAVQRDIDHCLGLGDAPWQGASSDACQQRAHARHTPQRMSSALSFPFPFLNPSTSKENRP